MLFATTRLTYHNLWDDVFIYRMNETGKAPPRCESGPWAESQIHNTNTDLWMKMRRLIG